MEFVNQIPKSKTFARTLSNSNFCIKRKDAKASAKELISKDAFFILNLFIKIIANPCKIKSTSVVKLTHAWPQTK